MAHEELNVPQRRASDTDPAAQSVKTYKIPTWWFTLGKVSLPALIAVIGMYYHVAELRTDREKDAKKIETLEAATADQAKTIVELQYTIKINLNDTKNGFEKISDSMVRVEKGISEIQGDVKDLQKRTTVTNGGTTTVIGH